MAYVNTTRPAPFGALTVFAVVRACESVLVTLRRRLIKSRTEAALQQMTDRELADIGLTRTMRGLDVIRYSPFSARV